MKRPTRYRPRWNDGSSFASNRPPTTDPASSWNRPRSVKQSVYWKIRRRHKNRLSPPIPPC
eukprot:scaffold16573_cov50-Attheya_sp.AAC.4